MTMAQMVYLDDGVSVTGASLNAVGDLEFTLSAAFNCRGEREGGAGARRCQCDRCERCG